MAFYTWKNHRCAFERVVGQRSDNELGQARPQQSPALLLIHPIGVGLSRQFWQPFIQHWHASHTPPCTIYNVDLLGCGDSDMPARAYVPEDWAEQLAYFVEQVAKEPVVLVVQGALLPVAVRLMGLPTGGKVRGMVLSGPPAWRLMTTPTASWKQKLAWNLFRSPLGTVFYRYARREKFVRSFSQRQLFEQAEGVTDEWLSMLNAGSREMNSRYAVFSFLAGFWRQDYAGAIARIQQPVMIVMGNQASSIERTTAKQEAAQKGKQETSPSVPLSQQRLQRYLDHFPRAEGVCIPGRNVMPYESPHDFVEAIAPFIATL